MRVQIVLGIAATALLAGLAPAGEVIKKEEVPGRIKLLKSRSADPKARAQAADELGRRGELRAPDVADAQEPLRIALQKDSPEVLRRAAAIALGRIASEPKENVPALMEALNDKSDLVKMAVAGALGQFGVEAQPAVPALSELAKNMKNKKLAQAARQALKMIRSAKK
jgi:HEAT repeat protein